MGVTSEKFDFEMQKLRLDWSGVDVIAVAVSGGPDSMALCRMLVGWAEKRRITVHALSVDHGLRTEAAEEAAQVGVWLADWPGVKHHILRWENPADTAIQEEARKARYRLMAEYCRVHDISCLFLAHHRDDQAETVLFRLAKGSGLDGLSGMQSVQAYDENLSLVRPLLGWGKDDILTYCAAEHVPYVEDPSNENPDYARVRLRRARTVLEEEGLSAKRLSVTAQRLARARKALQELTLRVYKQATLKKDTKHIVLKLSDVIAQPEEIVLRCVLLGLADLRSGADYAPRMERIEALVSDLLTAQNRSEAFRKRTLGGVVFSCDSGMDVLQMELEN
ncbi:MAG: tRNA lysidine(34) synthetase TilS [Rhodospirillales bacterium]|nr:tRNA lysidine(34) synthetase TilS [Rhodospirillales bacterium]